MAARSIACCRCLWPKGERRRRRAGRPRLHDSLRVQPTRLSQSLPRHAEHGEHGTADIGQLAVLSDVLPTAHLNGQHTAFGRVIEGHGGAWRSSTCSTMHETDPPKADKIIKAEVVRDRGRRIQVREAERKSKASRRHRQQHSDLHFLDDPRHRLAECDFSSFSLKRPLNRRRSQVF